MAFASITVKATIDIHQCLEYSPPGAPTASHWVTRGLRVSCEALGDLVIEPELVRFIRDQDRVYLLDEGVELLSTMRESQNRMAEFLITEVELFNRAGLPVSATEHLIQ